MGPMSLGDLIGSLKNGKNVEGYLRDLARRYKDHDPDAARQIKKAAEDLLRAVPIDPFDRRMDEVDDDYRRLKKAFRDAGAGEVAEDIDHDIQKGMRKKAAKWAVREIMKEGGPDPDQLQRMKETALNGQGEEQEVAKEALRELSEQGYKV